MPALFAEEVDLHDVWNGVLLVKKKGWPKVYVEMGAGNVFKDLIEQPHEGNWRCKKLIEDIS